MCGILGFSNGPTRRELTELKQVLQHRGPDGFDTFADEFVSLLHWRLAIIDLSDRASQPFQFEELVLLLNGEIYNFREVGEELKKQGYALTTQSDTEVVIKAFHCWGCDAVHKFTGMFAFVVYNRKSREIWLFRDRMGVKPMYYSLQGGLTFGSEMKVFRKLGQSLSIDRLAQRQYFRFGFTPGERTIFTEVKRVPPGHYLHYSSTGASLHQYWSIPVSEPGSQQSSSKDLEQALTKAFSYRLVSDVPVGVLLSGGIDSSLVATLLQHKVGYPLKTFTIGFDESGFDETTYAGEIAKRLGTDHTEFRLRREDAREKLLGFYEVYDEPFSDASGIPTTLVASLAREKGVKVVLSADGGDELFGGYPHYLRIDQFRRQAYRLPSGMRSVTSALLGGLRQFWPEGTYQGNMKHRLSTLGERLSAPDTIALFEEVIANQTNREIDELLGDANRMPPLLRTQPSLDALEMMMRWDAQVYLPDDLLIKVDRASMNRGVESRDPFLDHALVEFVQHLPLEEKINGPVTKVALRKILLRYHPAEMFGRPKQGFSIPLFAWFSQDLDKLFGEYFNATKVEEAGLQMKAVTAEHRRYVWCKQHTKEYNMEKMWRLLSFMMWHQRWGS